MVAPAPDVTPRWGIGAVAVAFCVALIGGTVMASLAVGFGAGATDAVTNTMSFLGEWAGFVGVPVWLSRTRGSGRLATDFGLRLGGSGDVGLGVLAGVLSYYAVDVYTVVLHHFDKANLGHEAQQLSGHGLGPGFAAFALTAALGAPIAEELFFRGLTQGVLIRRFGPAVGVAATAVIFGVVHITGNPVEAIPALAAFGVVLGMLAWRTGRLGPGIVAHMVFNGITVIGFTVSRLAH